MDISEKTSVVYIAFSLLVAALTGFAECFVTVPWELTFQCLRPAFTITSKSRRLSSCRREAERHPLLNIRGIRIPSGFLITSRPRANAQHRCVRRCNTITTISSRHQARVQQLKNWQMPDHRRRRTRQHFFYASQRETGVQSLRMITAPPGSALDNQLRVILEDPIKNLPWDQYVPFHKKYGRGPDNAYLRFLEGKWTFIDTLTYSEVSAGVIDGGPENYSGEGTSLPFHPLSIDRQSSVPWPQPLNHGVGYRESRDTPFAVRLDRLPDGNQDIYFGECDEALEARLWGSWDAPYAAHSVRPETGWREANPDQDLTGLVPPWTQKCDEVNEKPLHYRSPSSGPPDASVELEMAARGRFGGYVTVSPGRHADAIEDCRRRHRVVTEAASGKQKRAQRLRILKASRQLAQVERELEELTDEVIRSHWADIRKHPVYIRAVVDGATHEAAVKAAMDVNAGCDRQAATKLLYAFDSAEGLEKQERPDHEGEGQVNPPDAAGKTIAVNLSLYGVAAYQESVTSSHSTVAEHEELYHTFLTEMHREGRFTDFARFMAAEEDLRYSQRPERRNFHRLMASYRPLWTMRKYGEEYGAALQPQECLEDKSLSVFGDALRWKGTDPCEKDTAVSRQGTN